MLPPNMAPPPFPPQGMGPPGMPHGMPGGPHMNMTGGPQRNAPDQVGLYHMTHNLCLFL